MTHRDRLDVPPGRRKALVHRSIRMIETNGSDVHEKQWLRAATAHSVNAPPHEAMPGLSSRVFDTLRRGAEATGTAAFQACRTASRPSRDASGIATPGAPSRQSWEAVSIGHYQCTLV
jgi:hypothetical protein